MLLHSKISSISHHLAGRLEPAFFIANGAVTMQHQVIFLHNALKNKENIVLFR